MNLKLFLLLLFLTISCGDQTSSHLNELINSVNDPQYIPHASDKLEYIVNRLPTEGKVERIWSGWWWPMYEGGTSSTKFGMSPLAKYDIAFNSIANDWERKNAKRYANIRWAGKCNGLAAAGIMTEEPIRPVIYKNVTFTVIDIKALLTDMWQGSGYIIGGRCNNRLVTLDPYGRIEQPECRDVNPATFHIAITNFIGIFKKAIIADIKHNNVVNNYVIEWFLIKNQIQVTKQEAIRLVQNIYIPNYTYNPQAVFFVQVELDVHYYTKDTLTYNYILELDQQGRIIGGEWIKGSKINHPDFIWRPDDPKSHNPYLNLNSIQEIYKYSI